MKHPPRTTSNTPTKAVAVALVVLASLVLGACGGSGGSASSATASTSASSTGPVPTRGRFVALRECLRKNGITLPQRKPGQGGPGRGLFLGGAGPRLPPGVSSAQFEAAVKKCGAFARGRLNRARRLNNPAYRQALTRFAACMRENGVKLPAPNTSGKGPIFNTSGVNTASASFTAASAKCRSLLGPSLTPGQGATGAPTG
jgi:hypothetical protein